MKIGKRRIVDSVVALECPLSRYWPFRAPHLAALVFEWVPGTAEESRTQHIPTKKESIQVIGQNVKYSDDVGLGSVYVPEYIDPYAREHKGEEPANTVTSLPGQAKEVPGENSEYERHPKLKNAYLGHLGRDERDVAHRSEELQRKQNDRCYYEEPVGDRGDELTSRCF